MKRIVQNVNILIVHSRLIISQAYPAYTMGDGIPA